MDLKATLYEAAMFSWIILLVGAWISVDLGYTAPWLSFADIPGGSTGATVGALVAALAGLLLIAKLQHRHESAEWQAAGRQAGLRPSADGGSTGGPELTGTVAGRTVTASYEKRKMSTNAEGGGSRVTFTIATAELSRPADEGVLIGRAGSRVSVENGVGTLDFDDMAEAASATEGLVAVATEELVLVGTSKAVVEAVDDGLSGEALRAIRDLNIVSVGAASGVVARWAEIRNEELSGSILEIPGDNLVDWIPGGATTVTVETRASIRDGDEIQRFVEAAVAIADGFEEAIARGPVSG
jgi:hypothetical protein